jgi:hypothetical protein
MQIRAYLTFIMLTVGLVLGNEIAPCDDPYSLGVVQRSLSDPTSMASSFGEKQTNRLGDRVSVAIVKIFSQDDLIKSTTIKKILPIIRAAFDQPKIVAYEKDRRPDVTLV